MSITLISSALQDVNMPLKESSWTMALLDVETVGESVALIWCKTWWLKCDFIGEALAILVPCDMNEFMNLWIYSWIHGCHWGQ